MLKDEYKQNPLESYFQQNLFRFFAGYLLLTGTTVAILHYIHWSPSYDMRVLMHFLYTPAIPVAGFLCLIGCCIQFARSKPYLYLGVSVFVLLSLRLLLKFSGWVAS